MNDFLRDVRYTLRTLGSSPVFTTIAILTLALGIGANTAIFSLVHEVILKSLPFHDPDRLVAVWDTYLPQYPKLGISPAEFQAAQNETRIFENTAWYREVPQNLNLSLAAAEPVEVHASPISPRLLPTLGVNPMLGRAFAEKEPAPAALLSYRLWKTTFNADPSVVGKSINLGDKPFAVLGVMPPAFKLPDWADLWLTQDQMGDETTNPVRHSEAFVGRLRPGVTVQQATQRLQTIASKLAAEHPKTSTGFGMRVAGLQEELTAKQRPALLLLLGAVALVLLIACGNVANLLLARATGRTKEMAMRTALGAGSWRLVRQLLTESVVLAVLGGVLGLAFARWTLRIVSPEPVPLDYVVLLYLLAVSVVTGLAFGLAPAVQILRSDLNGAMKSGAAPGGGSNFVRGSLVVMEFALALVLVVGAAILVKSFLRMMNVNPGFKPEGLLTMRIAVPPSRKPDILFRRIQERVSALPGVESIATANTLPLVANEANTSRFNVPGSPLINPDALPAAQLRFISPDYFHVMRIPVLSGRAYTDRDATSPFIIINEGMARRFWPGQDPVGRKFITGPWGPNPTYSTIIGVVGDVKQFGLDSEPTYDFYFLFTSPTRLIIRTAGDPMSLAAAVRREIHSVDPELPVSEVRSMDQVVSVSARTRRWTMGLLAAFASLALILALIGIYGVLSWSVAQRTREIGIRMAIGARAGQVLAEVIAYAMKLAAAGLLIGIVASFALRRVLTTLVFNVSTADPAIYIGVSILMLLVALAASYIPARQATQVDPVNALRTQ